MFRFARGEMCGGRRAHRGFGHGGYWQRGGRRGLGGGRGGERIFDQGDLRILILRLIAEKPRHGYEIIKAIEEMLGGAYSPSPGVVYPTLTLLEDLGHATLSAGEGGKKLYAITADGTAFMDASKATVTGVEARVAAARAAFGDGPPPQIVRAMENLRTALRLRLSRGPLREEQVQAVADTLDAAAAAVERA